MELLSSIIISLISKWEQKRWFFVKMLDTVVYPELLKKTPGVIIGENIRLLGRPRIEVSEGSKIIIGESVCLRSRNQYNHLTFYGPITLISNGLKSHLKIGDRCVIGGTCIHAEKDIVIGSDCLIASNVQIFDCPGHEACFASLKDRLKTPGKLKPVKIEDYVWIGSNSIILPGSQIGYGSIIASGSVVSGRFPSHSIIMGNPAKLVMRHAPKENE